MNTAAELRRSLRRALIEAAAEEHDGASSEGGPLWSQSKKAYINGALIGADHPPLTQAEIDGIAGCAARGR